MDWEGSSEEYRLAIVGTGRKELHAKHLLEPQLLDPSRLTMHDENSSRVNSFQMSLLSFDIPAFR
jgi:hypothetical protein